MWSGTIVSLTSIAAEFRGSIETSIPQIVALLQDSESEDYEAGVQMLLKLAEQGT